MRLTIRLAFAAVTILTSCVGLGMSIAAPSPDLNNVIDSFARSHAFNGMVLLTDRGTIVFERAYGLADRKSKRPVTSDTRFQVGSISKWFTTLAALRLVDQGRLDIDAPISLYLPGYPAEVGKRVDVVHLLSNMSGIKDRLSTEYINRPEVASEKMTTSQAVKRFGFGPLVFAPGTRFDYTHTNWLLVQAVLEQASGEPMETLLDETVLAPAHLVGSGVTHGDFRPPQHAVAYASGAPNAPEEVHVIPPYLIPTGTIYSTAADLSRLAHQVYETSWLSPVALKALMTVHEPSEHYAIGGRVLQQPLGGRTTTLAWEIGSMGGFKALLVHAVHDDRTLVLLNNTNLDEDVLTHFAESVLHTWYAQAATKPPLAPHLQREDRHAGSE
ncbi:beta-lactamase family protein [Luteibacter jiangsuensis]|uniref:Beta-lactamase family protein n=1 Tax=Luteibacter jiangsuensis TaxID=637577 RepID=A0ABX0Q1W4_9GAMM|nr:serine hydrolase domain-containing protein [Luteibacter jiangsuensis]NID04510.1 beta-lactamase family protein [Luteibacter jiangsuensis]